MVTYGTKRTERNVNTLPKWARAYIITNGASGKLMGINSLPQWARAEIKKIKQHNLAHENAEKEYIDEECKGCKHKRKCTPKNRDLCFDMRDVPPCG